MITIMTNIKQSSLIRVVPTRLTTSDYESLANLAKQENTTITAFIRAVLIECINRKTKLSIFN